MRTTYIFIFILFLALIVRVYFYFSTQKQYQNTNLINQRVTLFSEPAVQFGTQSFSINNVKVYAPAYPEYHYGDTLEVTGRVSQISIKQSYTYLALKNPRILKINAPQTPLLQTFRLLREKIKTVFNAGLPPTESGFLLGIVFGIRDQLPASFKSDLKNTGTLHVVAASGMNVTMLAGMLLGFFSYFLHRKVATVVTIFAISGYAILSGLDPSIIRASLMASIALAGLVFGRQNFSYISLLITVFIMLFFTPGQLLSTGFQLSVASTIGILAWKPILDKIMIRIFNTQFLDDFTTTLSAQLVSLPILIISFGTYSILSILVNFLVLWTIPLLMILGSLAAVVGFIHPAISLPFLYASYPLLAFFEAFVKFFSGISIIVSLSQIPFAFLMAYYSLLVAGYLAVKDKI